MSKREPITDPIFYVYVIRVDGVDRYIGKGKGPRASVHLRLARQLSNGTCRERTLSVHRELAKCLDRDIAIVKLHEGLLEREAFAIEIAEISARQGLWNASQGGEGPSGLQHTPETRAKISAAQMGRKHRPETLARMRAVHSTPEAIERSRASNARRKATAETRAKLKAASSRPERIEQLRAKMCGKPKSPEHRAKISAALRGRVISAEAREKISEKMRTPERRAQIAAVNKAKVLSSESLAKMRASQLGKKLSPEHIEKMRIASLGRRHSDETRARISAIKKEYWARRREEARGKDDQILGLKPRSQQGEQIDALAGSIV